MTGSLQGVLMPPGNITLHWRPARVYDTRNTQAMLVRDRHGEFAVANIIVATDEDGLCAYYSTAHTSDFVARQVLWMASLGAVDEIQQTNPGDPS